MKNNSSVQKKVDAALRSFDGIQPAAPSPFFSARVLAGINKINNSKATVWEKWSAFFLRPTIAFATICIIIVLNTLALYSKMDAHVSGADQVELASSDEYSETVTAFYDLENVKP